MHFTLTAPTDVTRVVCTVGQYTASSITITESSALIGLT